MTVPFPRFARFAFPHASLIALLLIACAPVAYIAAQVILTSRNVPFWDDYDSALGFVLHLDAGSGWREAISRFFHLDSGHRTVTSRLLLAGSYWLTGGVNFHVIGVIGNFTLVGLCVILVADAPGLKRRVRRGAVLALGLFHLQHYEPFLWSGASIDHFQILLLAAGALAALNVRTRVASAGAALLAILATFTLAHGCVVWPVGALLLVHQRRWRELAGWSGIAVAALAIFLYGYEINPAHRPAVFSIAGVSELILFWLALLGGPVTLGVRATAPAVGLALLLLVGWLGARGALTRQPVLMTTTLFALGSLALIAFGRVSVGGDHIQSRYLVVASLAWSLAICMAIEHRSDAKRPFLFLTWCLPALIVFNLASNLAAAPRAETFLLSRDYPAIRYKQFGDDSHASPFRLHPTNGTAKRVLTAATERGIYTFPRFCNPRTFADAQPNPRLVTYVTDLTATGSAVGFEGWAMIPQQRSKPGSIHVVLRSAQSTLFFTTLSVVRPDVAKAFKQPLWRYCGYNFALLRHRLPNEDFQIGLLIANGDRVEYAMTDQWLRLAAPAAQPPQLASDR